MLFHHGIGSSAALWRGWSLERMVEDLSAVADAVGLARFHRVGESIGGTVGLAAAIARPERIATLTVSNGAHLGTALGRVHAWKKQLDEAGPGKA
jgi:pimeloyl-ACP methyl ester carboxylesterase